MKRTDLLAWLGVPTWVVLLSAVTLLVLPLVKISTVQPAKIQISIGGSK
ncbi:MAG TPA: hypothetical protein VK211_21075 [Kamptonema sp.]|nr:hypothetical protein [Kamptonema sp.]